MFERSIAKALKQWAGKQDRKPLILRGARQVGKTSAIELFSENFDHYVYLNLELPEDKKLFHDFSNVRELVQAIFFRENIPLASDKTLLFIDEIQEEPLAIKQLRYFYEQLSGLYVVAAGSLLEAVLSENLRIPVGRVEYLVLRPVSFPEFLSAIGEPQALQQLEHVPLRLFAHDKLLKLFHTYSLIGGMPGVVKHYAANRDITALKPIYESLIVSYIDDLEKYARNQTMRNVMRHAIIAAFREAGKRIKFEGFGRSNYRSREMSEALRTLEKAMVIHLLYPTTDTKLPHTPDYRKSPRLMTLDTGMFNHFSGLQLDLLSTKDINDVYTGRVSELIVGQELLACNFDVLHQAAFWVRQKKDSSAEVDYLHRFQNLLIPIEVKSGATGRLRSLHLFMDKVEHKMAVRFCAEPVKIHTCITPLNKTYYLMNLPYYTVSQLDRYLQWLGRKIN